MQAPKRRVTFPELMPITGPAAEMKLRGLAQEEELVGAVAQALFASVERRYGEVFQLRPSLAPAAANPLIFTCFLGKQANQVNLGFDAYFKRVAEICWKEVDAHPEDGVDLHAARLKKLQDLDLQDKILEIHHLFLKQVAAQLKKSLAGYPLRHQVQLAVWQVVDTEEAVFDDPLQVNVLEVSFWKAEEVRKSRFCCFHRAPPPEPAFEEKGEVTCLDAALYSLLETGDAALLTHVRGYDPEDPEANTLYQNGIL